jgi:hypothetical protein
MTQQHPIVPPPELVKQWIKEFSQPNDPRWQEYEQDIATCAAQWGADQQLKLDAEQIEKAYQAGADQELEACCEWFQRFYRLESWMFRDLARLRAARRPKPTSLKEQALKDVDEILKNPGSPVHSDFDRIISALKSIPDPS